jgi:hypothetical protein
MIAMGTIRRPMAAPVSRAPTTELSSAELRALVQETRKRKTSSLEVEMIRVDAREREALLPLDDGDPLPAGARTRLDRDAMEQLDDGDPLPAGARTRLDRDAMEQLDDGDPLPFGARTRIDRDALAPLPRPAAYPPQPIRRVSPALLVALALAIALSIALWVAG